MGVSWVRLRDVKDVLVPWWLIKGEGKGGELGSWNLGRLFPLLSGEVHGRNRIDKPLFYLIFSLAINPFSLLISMDLVSFIVSSLCIQAPLTLLSVLFLGVFGHGIERFNDDDWRNESKRGIELKRGDKRRKRAAEL